jgi:hypothetical protein
MLSGGSAPISRATAGNRASSSVQKWVTATRSRPTGLLKSMTVRVSRLSRIRSASHRSASTWPIRPLRTPSASSSPNPSSPNPSSPNPAAALGGSSSSGGSCTSTIDPSSASAAGIALLRSSARE